MRTLAGLLVGIAALSAIDVSRADVWEWEVAFPELEEVRALLAYVAPDTFYVASWPEGRGMELVRSTDNGTTWETIASGVGSAQSRHHTPRGRTYAISVSDPEVVYGSDHLLMRTMDGGAAWETLVVPELYDPHGDTSAGDIAFTHVVACRLNRARIAFVFRGHPIGYGVYLRDLATGDMGHIWMYNAGISLWTHPETGTVYYSASEIDCKRYGVIDFDELTPESLSVACGSRGGYGFSSGDPDAIYFTARGKSATTWGALKHATQ